MCLVSKVIFSVILGSGMCWVSKVIFSVILGSGMCWVSKVIFLSDIRVRHVLG